MSATTTSLRVAANVRAEMARGRRSQAELGAALGLQQSAVSKRLHGRIPWTVDELDAASRFLGVPTEVLMSAAAQLTEQVSA